VTRAIAITVPITGFEEFLYSRISEDDATTSLSVLSIIASYDIDPWEEAARLSRLPEDAAIKELGCLLDCLLGALPRDVPAPQEPARTASRLVALLPHRDRVPLALRRILVANVLQRPPALLVAGILFFLINIAVMVRS
jgi:hypothetical protein